MKILKIDKNFNTENKEDEKIEYHSYNEEFFSLYGIFPPENDRSGFFRLDKDVAKKCNDGVKALNFHTAGGRLRFKTNSPKISIKTKMCYLSKMPHMAFTGSIGFDLYEKTEDGYKYINTFVPPTDIEKTYTSSVFVGDKGLRDYTINFPLYSGVKNIEIGIKTGSVLEKSPEYTNNKTIVYYGSSITQGGCASRPGNAYQSIITRYFDCDHINLGFSGSAKGEKIMAEYIRDLEKLDVFVCDYDHNAPTAEHLKETLLPFVNVIREKKKNIPVIFMSRPQPNPTEDDLLRRDIVKDAYITLKNNNDNNVYFIDGTRIMDGISKDSGTVDNCHPNDFGFMCMARKLIDVLESINF